MKGYTWLAFVAVLLSSCGPTYRPFTKDLQDSYEWSESDLKHIQFYLSRDIVLQRNLRKGESVIKEGKIILRDGRRVEEIVIREGTPGLLLFMPKENRMAVSFEEGKDRFLMFGPHPKWDGRYMLLGSSWDRSQGEVTYRGKKYRTSSRSAMASLMVDLDRVSSVSAKRRVAKGRRI